MDGNLTLTLRAGDEAVVETPTGNVTVRAIREEPGRVRVVIVAPREWPIRRAPRASEGSDDAPAGDISAR